ncbi:hypothetical protein chiPu_0029950, partial [Chiloscyllium punctatum]|nr:hypothetical protein [Chiloscyllium punctatum]
DARRAAVNQQRLAGLERAALEHIVPHRHQRFRNRTGFLHRELRRHGHRLRVLRDAILRVAAAGDQRHHLVADLVLGAFAERHHFARDLEAGQVAGAGRRRIGAGALRDVGTIDAGGRDLDQDLAGLRHRQRAGLRHQHLRATGLADGNDGHLRGQVGHGWSLVGEEDWRMAYRLLQRSETPLGPEPGSLTAGFPGALLSASSPRSQRRAMPRRRPGHSRRLLRAHESHCKILRTGSQITSRGGHMPIEDEDRPRKKISHEIGQDLS